ncbi:MAG: SDR family oxidoreductase, partial [Actinomycetota bacterium]|nr:SDR family oxidoreductase [Actinomycetota bacterium]
MTGASRGVGQGIAQELARSGYEAIGLVRDIENYHVGPAIAVDISSAESLDVGLADLLARTWRIDVLVLNAGVRRLAWQEAHDDEDWSESFAVNVTAPRRILARLLPILRASSALVCVIGSHAAWSAFEGGGAYSASKAALRMVAETLRIEERQSRLRVSYLDLGAVANRAGDRSPNKMSPRAVGQVVAALAA